MNINKVDLAKLSDKYNKGTLFRMVLSSLPYVGNALDILLTSKSSEYSEKRLVKLINNIENEIKLLDENKINIEYLKSEEFYDLFINVMHIAIKTRNDDKIKILSKLLRDNIVNQNHTEITEEDLLTIINELTLNDIDFIKIILKYKNIIVEDIRKIQGVSINMLFHDDNCKTKEYYAYFLIRFEKLGLLVRSQRAATSFNGLLYNTTPSFKTVVSYLEN